MFQSGTRSIQTGRRERAVAKLATAAALILATAALLGWVLNDDLLRTLVRGTAPMLPVTAAGVLASSIAWLLAGRASKWRSGLAYAFALAVVIAGVVVIFEYLSGINLGIDRVLFPRLLKGHPAWNGGRIAPNTALNFILVGTALLLFVKGQSLRIAELLTVAAGVIAVFALCGYGYGEPRLYMLSHFTPMSLPTSAAFLLLCVALLSPRVAQRQGFGILLGAVLLLAVVSVNTIASLDATKNLVERNNWVEHTRMATNGLDAVVVDLLNMETGERGYLYTGERRYLEPYELGKVELDRHLGQLAGLISDNPVQMRNLDRLTVSARGTTEFFQQAITLEAAGDHRGARQLVLTGRGRMKMDAVRSLLEQMKAAESNLLASRLDEARRSERYLLLTVPASHAFTALLVVLGGLLVSRDLRKRAETARKFRELAQREHAAKKESEAAHQRTESVLSGISEMFMLLDHDWKIAYVNEQAVRLTGRSRQDLLGQVYWKAFPEALGTIVEEAYRRSRVTRKPEAFERFDAGSGKWFNVHLYPSPGALTIFAQDITGLKAAQEALMRAEKLSAVGRMASAVAHEINNPLEAVTNLIWIARNDPSASESVRKRLGMADDELRRVAHITKQALGFYRDTSQPEKIKLSGIIDSVLGLYASRIANKQISVRTEYDNSEVFGYAGQLRQLFANLCANAIDAVQARGALFIRISRSHAWKESEQAGIRVTIADDGCGIPAEHLRNLFEPFFTTKESTGTGLGLWVAKQIAEKHGGRISVRSGMNTARHYTVFSVFLPLREELRPQEFAVAS